MLAHYFIPLSILLYTIPHVLNQSNTTKKNVKEPVFEEEEKIEIDPNEVYESEELNEIQIAHQAFTREWNLKMYDYESPYVYIIPVAYKSRQIFYENITTVPIRVRGAFLLDDTNADQIHFTIRAPNSTVIYSNTTHSDIFEFNADAIGLYEIAFNNAYKNGELKPTFTMNTQQNEILKKDDLNHTELAIDQMITFLKGIGTEDKMKRNVHRERYLSKLFI